MKIALIGNQNSGKTTLFNLLTGMNQKIGNWPGVTVEKKEGLIKETAIRIIDLPGVYSLSPYTLEEEISCDYLFAEKPDLIVNVVDANALERSLYLTTQLLELDIPLIVALNMTDLLVKTGSRIDTDGLRKQLGVPVVSLSARRGRGVRELISLLKNPAAPQNSSLRYSSVLESGIQRISSLLPGNNKRFIAVKLMEHDKRFDFYLNDDIKTYLQQYKDIDFEEMIATERYQLIASIKKKTVDTSKRKIALSDKIDRIVLNKFLAFPIFILVMFGLYFTVSVAGGLFGEFIGDLFNRLSVLVETGLNAAGASGWMVSLIVDGIISGISAVITFIPQIAVLFSVAAFLESTGYLSRVSFLLDKFFNRLGLSGRTIIPFIVGFGCSVPGVMATRTIESEQERKSAIILVPFIPCGAKLPIISLFAGYFFTEYRALITTSFFFLSIVIIVISALILKKIFKTAASSYISELPDYRFPDFKYITHDVWDKTYSFIKRAGTVILVGSVVIWVLLSFSPGLRYGVDIQSSILAKFGNLFAWFFYPIVGSWSWVPGVSAIQGLVAKEQVVASLSIIAGVAGGGASAEIFNASVFSFFNPAAAFAFTAFNLFSAPCIGAIGAMRKELGSTAKVAKAVLFQTGMAWLVSVFFYAVLSGFWGLL